jgi:magnesium chelatase subunit I
MKFQGIKTLGELRESGYQPKSIKEEMRHNLISKLQSKESAFPDIYGYDDSVIPEVERAILSKHNILFLGLRGQAKTRMARLMTNLLDEQIPYIAGSDIYDDPFAPISKYGRDLVDAKSDATPIAWLYRKERYGEKLATPDVTVADLIGDIDPIKAANLKLSFADEQVLHYGIIPRSNRGIFVINELPDLQARIQVALFNILEEGDIQIRGFKLRMPLDILFVFTANPEDYTNRGSIVTPLKDRIQSQILTHYPKDIETALLITTQEAHYIQEQKDKVQISDFIKRIIEQIAVEARNSELVDKKSGVSARLTISAFENAVSTAERRAILNKEKETIVWVGDLIGTIPSITGKIELVYEGEQEGPFQVAIHLLNKAIRTQFVNYFPNPDSLKKKRVSGKSQTEGPEEPNPYKPITAWFDKGNVLHLYADMEDAQRIAELYRVDGLHSLAKKYFKQASDIEHALLMEFILHGLSAYSLIHKNTMEGTIEFKDLMGSMLDMDFGKKEDDDFEEF